jgi:uncharacterized RDD family membrane protein YckC
LPRLLGAGARGVRAVAGATGLDQAAERTTEDAIVAAIESPAFERAIVRVLESPAFDEALDRALSSPEVERAVIKVLDSRLIDSAWEHLLASDEAQKLVERVAEAPEVRAAIASQGVGLLDDLGRQLREIAGRFDSVFERVVRRLLRRPLRAEPTNRVGLVTRGLAFVLDAVVLNGIFLLLIAVLSALFGSDGFSATGVVISAGAWILFGSAYLLIFWSLAGQTPGMRVLSIRIESQGSRRLGLRCARRRLFGAVAGVLAFGLGLVGVVTRDDRRSWADRRADTDVVTVERIAPYSVRRPA